MGEYSISGGSRTAAFFISTTSFVPSGSFQWFKNGGAIEGATNSLLQLANVVEDDAGLYHCVVTHRGYTETTRAATLEVRKGTTNVPPVSLDLRSFVLAPGSLTIPAWPEGYVLQQTRTLSPANWETIFTTSPALIDITAGFGFLRLWSESQPGN